MKITVTTEITGIIENTEEIGIRDITEAETITKVEVTRAEVMEDIKRENYQNLDIDENRLSGRFSVLNRAF